MITLGDVFFNLGVRYLGLNQAQQKLQQLGATVSQTTAKIHQSKTATELLAARLRDLASGVVFIQGPLGGFAARISSLAAVMGRGGLEIAAFTGGVATAAIAVSKFGSTLLDAGKAYNSYQSQLQAVTGTLDLSEQAFRRVESIARFTGVQIADLAPAFAKFSVAASSSGMALKDMEELFTTVAAASTKLQLSSEQTSGVFRALEQMMSKGTVQAEELRGQLGDRLPGAVVIAARALGVTTAKLQEMMKKGQVVTRDFLPKFTAELRRSLNIDSKPIDNYTAAYNNMSNAWLQLRVKMDQGLNVTKRVMEFFKSTTEILDYLRINLDKVKLAAVATIGAMAGFAAPALIGMVLSLGKAILTLALNFGVLNKVMGANLFVRLTTIIVGMGAALYQFRDEIRLTQNSIVTFGDVVTLAVEELKKHFDFSAAWSTVQEFIGNFTKHFSWGWSNVDMTSAQAVVSIATVFKKMFAELEIIARTFFNNIMADLKAIFGAANDFRKWISPWIDDPTGGMQPSKGFDWFESTFGNKEYVRKSWKELQDEVTRMWEQPEPSVINAVKNYGDRLNQLAMKRIYSDPTRGQDVYKKPGPGLESIFKGGGFDTASEASSKAAAKLKDAIDNVNRAIANTREEIDALGGPDGGLDALTEKFKREKEVEKYSKALRKAGASTEFVTAKTNELLTLLETRDIVARTREALETMRDVMANSFEVMGNALFDAAFKGENALEALKQAAIQSARDILNTWWKLAALNPFKNALFGTNEPTLSGGWLSKLGGLVGGLFGGGGGGSSVVDPWAGMRFAKGGAFGSDLLTSPTWFSYGAGKRGVGGEAGEEAIMPLKRDSSGRLGVVNSGSSGGGESRIMISLSPDLIGQILEQAKGQSIAITAESNAKFVKTKEFSSRVITSVKQAKNSRQL